MFFAMIESFLEVLLTKIPVHPTDPRSNPIPIRIKDFPLIFIAFASKTYSKKTHSTARPMGIAFANPMEISQCVVQTNACDMLGDFTYGGGGFFTLEF